MTVGEKITKLRHDNNLTQEQFADILKVSRQSVSKWELNTAYPDTEKLIRMSKLFNVSLDYLLKDEIDNSDITVSQARDDARSMKLRASILTYLSFPPIIGVFVGIYSLIFQFKNIRNKKQIILTIIGLLVSIGLTTAIILGITLNI